MKRALTSLGVATVLVSGMVACGIKGPAKPPLAAPVPATETPPPPSDTAPVSVESSGPSIIPTADGGAVTPTSPVDAGTP